MVSPVCHVLHIVGPALVTSSLPESLIFDSQFGCCSFPLIFTREATHVGIVQASAVVILIHGLECVNGVCCPVCLCHRIVDVHNRSPPAKNDRSVINGCRCIQLAATSLEVSHTERCTRWNDSICGFIYHVFLSSLLMTAFAEFCCCVHANYSELGASVASPSLDRRNR